MSNATQTNTIQLKRQITVKTVVTERFKADANVAFSEELQLIQQQSQQLENQYQQALQNLEKMAAEGQNVQPQMEQLQAEVKEKRLQLATLHQGVSHQLQNLDKVPLGELVVTGMLENYVEVQVGDPLYQKIKNAEIILEDGLVKAIRG